MECFLYVFGKDADGSEYVAARMLDLPFLPTPGLAILVGSHPDDEGFDVEMEVEAVSFDLTTESLNVDLAADGWSSSDLRGWGFLVDRLMVQKREAPKGNVVPLRPKMKWVKEAPKEAPTK